MPQSEFIRKALAAGVDIRLATFMDANLAKYPHSHEIEEVEGLPEALSELGVEIGEEEDEEEEEEGEEETEEL